jgi:hypothetical protein
MNREVRTLTKWEQDKAMILHWWRYLTNKRYRASCKIRWEPEVKLITPRAVVEEELRVQPMFTTTPSLPIISRIQVRDSSEQETK